MSRVLVTGGAGFIGSHVVDRLLAAGHEPVVLDIRPSPHHDTRDVDTRIADVRDPDAVRRAMRGCDAVAHLAAAADVGEVESEPADAEQLNARGTLNVLQAAREAGVERVLYASTIWVYSAAGNGALVDEETPLGAPAHLYTATKLAGELYCRAYAELYGVETTILRFGIPYGPRARPAAVLPSFVGRALAGEPLTVAGTGEQTRRFVYVEDLADGVVAALDPVAANRTYNLVGSEDVSVREIAATVAELVGDTRIVHVPGRAGDLGSVAVCAERAARELGWRARTTFREGAARYVDWHRREPPAVPAAPDSPPGPSRYRVLGQTAAVAVVALVAGAIAAALARVEALSDPASFLGTMVLLGVPVALLARVDWARDRRRGALVAITMLGGALLTAVIWPNTVHMVHLAREHVTLLVLMAAAAGGVLAARGLRAAQR